LPPDGILPGAKFTLRPSLAFSYIGSVTARNSSSGQTLRRGIRNGITELSQRAPPIFGWAAMTLGICPHSSMLCFYARLAVSIILFRGSKQYGDDYCDYHYLTVSVTISI